MLKLEIGRENWKRWPTKKCILKKNYLKDLMFCKYIGEMYTLADFKWNCKKKNTETNTAFEKLMLNILINK